MYTSYINSENNGPDVNEIASDVEEITSKVENLTKELNIRFDDTNTKFNDLSSKMDLLKKSRKEQKEIILKLSTQLEEQKEIILKLSTRSEEQERSKIIKKQIKYIFNDASNRDSKLFNYSEFDFENIFKKSKYLTWRHIFNMEPNVTIHLIKNAININCLGYDGGRILFNFIECPFAKKELLYDTLLNRFSPEYFKTNVTELFDLCILHDDVTFIKHMIKLGVELNEKATDYILTKLK